MKRMLAEWRDAVHFVKPDTVVRVAQEGLPLLLEAQVQVETGKATDQHGR